MRYPILLAAALGAACNATDTSGPGPRAEPATLTVDASADWAWVRLGDPAATVAVTDRATSTAWDLGFFATSVMLNGGAAGSAGVEGHCLCANADLPDAAIMAMTAESEAAAFEAVGLTAVPVEPSAWETDALDPAIGGWWRYDSVTHRVSADASKVWKIRTTAGGYAKLRVIAIEGATRDHAGRVTFQHAYQDAAGTPFGEVRTTTVDVAGGTVRVDLSAEGLVDGADWDLAFEGYTIRINGGVSGSGGVGAVLADESFEEMTDAGDAPASVYRGDAFGGVFVARPWYRYNLRGNHQIWPTYDVYLIRRGTEIWKVQLIGYYDVEGRSRRITFRYARLGD